MNNYFVKDDELSMEYHHSRIIKMSTKELIFLDLNDEEKHINFCECRNNWVQYINNSEITKNDLSEYHSRCVAWRDAFSKPPYIEFFTEPKTKFIYPYKRTIFERIRKTRSNKGYKIFRKTCRELENYGWTTFDLG